MEERKSQGELSSAIPLERNEIIVHVTDCEGYFQNEFKAFENVVEESKSFEDDLKSLCVACKSHVKSDCELLGTFALSDKIGTLFVHSGDYIYTDEKQEILDNFLSAARDMLVKVPRDSTLHSQPFSLERTGGPNWAEIRTVFEKALKETPTIKWIFWSSSNDDNGEIPQLSLSFRPLNLKDKESVCVDQNKLLIESICAEMDSVDELFKSQNGSFCYPSEVVVSEKKPGSLTRQKSWLSSLFNNVRDSVDLAKVRQLKEKKKNSDQVLKEIDSVDLIDFSNYSNVSRIRWSFSSDYEATRKKQLQAFGSNLAGKIRSSISLAKSREFWEKKKEARKDHSKVVFRLFPNFKLRKSK